MDLKLSAVSEPVWVTKSMPCNVIIHGTEDVTGHHSILSRKY